MSDFFYLKMKKLYNNYINTFKGLSKEVWWLALITFINRSGTMIIPFLSLYLREDMGISQSNVGWVMTSFGIGSVVGVWIGGKLTDSIGYYKVMVRSLFFTGLLFIALQYVRTFMGFCLCIFFVIMIADIFRPAMFVAMSVYSKQENKTRSVTLIRLAINLGFSAGPVLGGLIITYIGYSGLFWVDGITCILATLLLVKVLNPKKTKPIDEVINKNPKSVYKDKPYWIFFIAMVFFAFIFMQYFSTMPLYYKDVHALTELKTALLLGLNGFLIFISEMPLIAWLETKNYTKIGMTIFGILLTVLSFVVLNISSWIGILSFGIFLMTVGEMVGFPMSNAFAMHRSKRGKQGEYLAMYVMSFSVAGIFGHNAGLQISAFYGYDFTWYVMTGLGIAGILLLIYLNRVLKKNDELF